MSKTTLKSVCLIIMVLALAVTVISPAGASDETEINDTAELKNGDRITGTLLTDTFSVTSPYSVVTVKKDKILEIRINAGYQNHDVIELKTGGVLEGTIEEFELSFKLASGKTVTLKKEQCKKITLGIKNE